MRYDPPRFAPDAVADPLSVRETMAPVSAYADREGYDPVFIDEQTPLPLPAWTSRQADIAPVQGVANTGPGKGELRYRHFSVKISKSRRLPIFSAVNIDGVHSLRGLPRSGDWVCDPRVGKEYQILRECYGEERNGMFSRGHMTRREDPNWGTLEEAEQADVDTFHVTNAVPQVQRFNAGLWLKLEEHVLSNTDRDNMRVTVITGPVFSEDDPEYFEVKTPIGFFKVVVFRHDITKALSAVGFRRSQARFLPGRAQPRFVFGQFEDTQVSLANISQATGLHFGAIADLDVMKGAGAEMEVHVASVDDLFLQA